MIKTYFLTLTIFVSLQAHARIDFNQLVVKKDKIYTTDQSFLNFTLDTSRVMGVGWWEDRPPLNLQNHEFINLVKALGPGSIRIGGTGSDYLYYSASPTPLDPHFQINLTKKKLDEISFFINEVKSELLFNLNAGKFFYGKDGFNTNQVELLFDYFNQSDLSNQVHFEFGNEVNAYWLIHGLSQHVSPKKYAAAYDKVQLVKNKYPHEWKLLGPSHALWPKLGHPLSFIGGNLKDFLKRTKNPEVASWHYYPVQSERCPLVLTKASIKNLMSYKKLNKIENHLKKIKSWRDQISPTTDLWMSETGSAQCGGQENISDTFASTFWWLDQLGLVAKYDHKRIYRQSLIGGHYGLIEEETLRPRVDYWTSLLWNRLMGKDVYSTHTIKEDHNLRTYMHSHKNNLGKVILAINLDGNHSKRIELPSNLAGMAKIYRLSSDSLDSKDLYINNKKMMKDENIEDIFRTQELEISGFNLNPHEIVFIHLI